MHTKQEIQENYKEGKSVISISQECGLTRERIYQILREMPNYKDIQTKLQKKRNQSYYTRYSEFVPEIISRRIGGESVSAISKTLGISFRQLKSILKGTQYENSKETRAQRNEEIIKQYKEGKKQKELAREFGLNQRSISAIVIKYG